MKVLVLLCLLTLSPQQSKPETVALVFGPEPRRIEIMKTEEAEKLYERLELKRRHAVLIGDDHYLHAALTVALGTLPRKETEVPPLNTRARLDWEIRRGVRLPTQKTDRGGDN